MKTSASFLTLCLLAALWASCSLMQNPVPSPREDKSFRIVAYATDAIIVNLIPYDKLTHINYSFLIPNVDGTFLPLNNAWKLESIPGPDLAAGVGGNCRTRGERQGKADRQPATRCSGTDDELAAGRARDRGIGFGACHGRPLTLWRRTCRRRFRRRDAPPRESAGRCRSGRCWSSPRRSRHRSACAFSSAAPPPP